uniref:Uncharacterized protein n=1 Tax=Kalanchoe fedtschenkoi TaxID=63787 RepID=A0A7N0RAP6_KALFE
MEAELTGDVTINNSDAKSGRVVKNLIMGTPADGMNAMAPTESISTAKETPIAPVTPIPAREVQDIRIPRPVQCRLSNFDAEEPECFTPQTPKQGVFDPFASGPDDMLLAPKLRKTTGETRISLARQLNFGSCSSGESSGVLDKARSDEEKMLDSVFANLLDVVVPSSTEGHVAEESAQDADADGFKTPVLVPCINGIPKKCPDAPMKQTKPTSKRFRIDASLCRKLEF